MRHAFQTCVTDASQANGFILRKPSCVPISLPIFPYGLLVKFARELFVARLNDWEFVYAMMIAPEPKLKPNRIASVVVGAPAVLNATNEMSQKSTLKERAASVFGISSINTNDPQKKENPSAGTTNTKKITSISVGPDSKDAKPTGDGSNLGVSSGPIVVTSVASRYLEAIHTPRYALWRKHELFRG